MDEPVRISDLMGEDYLKHYGVKGMKWGVRRSDDGSTRSERKAAKKTAKADQKFEKKAGSDKVFYDVYNKAAKSANAKIDTINNSAKYKGKDLRSDSKLMTQYNRDVQTMFNKSLKEAADSMGTNASGTRRYGIQFDNNGNWSVKSENVKHADDGDLYVVPKYDELGHILSFDFTTEKPELKHYGVKGMKWGVRRTDAQLKSAKPQASDDVKAVRSAERKIKSGGTKSLSNQELQSVITRMNLEKQYQNLSQSPNKSVMDQGNSHIKKAVGLGKTLEEARKFSNTPTGQAIKTGLGAAFAAGAAYATGGTSAAATAGASVVLRRAANHYTNVGN